MARKWKLTLKKPSRVTNVREAFTKRSMELAEQRKAFEAEAAQTKQLRDAYAQQLELMQAQTPADKPPLRNLTGQP